MDYLSLLVAEGRSGRSFLSWLVLDVLVMIAGYVPSGLLALGHLKKEKQKETRINLPPELCKEFFLTSDGIIYFVATHEIERLDCYYYLEGDWRVIPMPPMSQPESRQVISNGLRYYDDKHIYEYNYLTQQTTTIPRLLPARSIFACSPTHTIVEYYGAYRLCVHESGTVHPCLPLPAFGIHQCQLKLNATYFFFVKKGQLRGYRLTDQQLVFTLPVSEGFSRYDLTDEYLGFLEGDLYRIYHLATGRLVQSLTFPTHQQYYLYIRDGQYALILRTDQTYSFYE